MTTDLPDFFLKDELAHRWRCSERTIDDKVKQGIITPSKRLPKWLVSVQQVLQAEEADMNPLSPFERRRLEDEIRKQHTEIERLRSILDSLTAASLQAMADLKRYASAERGRKDAKQHKRR